jgi:type I restriction enzyme S subunit
LREGWKQTEVGLIPGDWECATVDHLIQIGALEKPLDGNHGNIHPKSADFVDFGIPFVMANNIQDGRLDLQRCAFIRKSQADKLQKGFSRSGDVLLTHKATIGNTAVVGKIPFEYLMLTPQVTYYRVANPQLLNNYYLRHFFDSNPFQNILRLMSGGGTRSYIGITAQRRLPVVMPSSEIEQSAIALVLNDIDALIASLDAVIAKKRDLKQATIQQLLTRKTRLPGFEGEWKKERLGSVADLYQSETIGQSVFTKTGFPVYGANGIVGFFNRFNHETPQITLSCRGNCGTINRTYGPAWITGNAMVINIDKNPTIDFEFLYQLLRSIDFSILVTGSGQPQIVRAPLAGFELSLPRTLEEQCAIATILSDMDVDLAAWEGRCDKVRLLKQGMMQELLTGRIRLV